MNLSYVLLLGVVVMTFGKTNVVANGTSNLEAQHRSNDTGRKTFYQKPGKIEYVALISNVTVEKVPSSNGNSVQLSWTETKNLNGTTDSYTIRYQRVDIEHAKYQDIYITQNQYRDQRKSFVINDLANGNYSFTIVANPSNGSTYYWSKPVYLYIGDSKLSATTITLIVLAILLVLGALLFWFYRRKH